MKKTMFIRAHRSPRAGVTFIELIGVLVVAIIIIAGALALYSEANTSSRTNQLVVALGALTGSVRALHANTGAYSAERLAGRPDCPDINEILVNSNAVPPGMLINQVPSPSGTLSSGCPTGSSGSIIRHAFGGQIAVYGFGQEFVIVAYHLDGDICIRIATESTAKTGSGLQRVYISNQEAVIDNFDQVNPLLQPVINQAGSPARLASNVSSFDNSTTTTTGAGTVPVFPISPADANFACQVDIPDANHIAWVYQ